MPWTEKQEKVINERGKTILVSAAAGSGKTATLVERIYKKVVDPEHPVDINQFLVVTFTKSAAAQMREKLRKKLDEAQEKFPESEHIAKQNVLVQSADITTIDSFCLGIVKEYFSNLDLDPSIGIGDPGMLEMLKYEVLDALFEEKYEQLKDGGAEAFALLLNLFGNGKSDDDLKNIINRIYRQIASFPDPDRYLAQARKGLEIETVDDLNGAAWMQATITLLHKSAQAGLTLVRQCMDLCGEPDGPAKYIPQFEADKEKLEHILHATDYSTMKQALSEGWMRLSAKKGGDPELIAECKEMRAQYKEEFDLKNLGCFRQKEERVLADMQHMREYLLPLLDITEEFIGRFMQEKQKRKILEFSDISHMAYKLVCAGYDADGCAVPTEIGKTIAARYQEIYIDEYQDSNYLQEDILTAVSGRFRGDNNMFMVGDIKQSIYRFRMARPEIFVNKYKRFSDEGDEIKIELNDNFRSRAVCLHSINYFFYQLMGEDLGGITYDSRQALNPGKVFPEVPEGKTSFEDVELLVADAADPGTLTKEQLESYGNPGSDLLEGYMIADRIKKLMDETSHTVVYDEDEGGYRQIRYKDIVILARSLKGYGETIYNALSEQGIPVHLDKSKGYFQAVEIQVIMSMLAVVDNSRQDIPLSAVLLSPVGDLTESELALVCASVRNKVKQELCLYEICEYYAETWEDTEIAAKLRRLLSLIGKLKEEKKHVSVSDLIWEFLQETGYYQYAMAMPAGNIRKANIDMLLHKAVQFENGYYKGLFSFLQYVDKLKLISQDEGEASTLSEEEDVVRIMSIHKSKGLEYPVVFVAGLGKRFNKRESQENVQVHPDYYLAAMAMYPVGRYKYNTAIRQMYAMLEDAEAMAESQRVLYVAMTRAKEKLILTGCLREFERVMGSFSYLNDTQTLLLPYSVRKDASCYLNQLLACMTRYGRLPAPCGAGENIRIEIRNEEQILTAISPQQVKQQFALMDIERQAADMTADAFYRQETESFVYEYPYMRMTELAQKMSISDIKRMKAYDGQGYDVATEFAKQDTQQAQMKPEAPGKTEKTDKNDKTKKPKLELSGSAYGTLMHKFMELLPFETIDVQTLTVDRIKALKKEFGKEGIFEDAEIAQIPDGRIMKFLQSELGCRMIEAARCGNLFKERQFSAGIPAAEVYDVETDDILVVQGIIDAYFYEGDAAVVMDYKTDAASEEVLLARYRAQIESYAEVVEQLTGKPVKDKYFYSFHLNKMIRV